MKHCQYCNSTEHIEETVLSGPNGDKTVYMCEPCFSQRVMFDEDPGYTASGEEVKP